MTWPDAETAFRRAGAVGLLPIGATEAHGPHLPLFTDVYLSLELAERVARALDADRPVMILPPLTLSVATYAAGFPGTISLRPETANGVLADLLASLHRHGLSTLALINNHLEPGHIAILKEAAASRPDGMRVLFVDHCRKPWALELTDEFKSGDCHAGSYETSMLLASRFRDRVRVDTARGLPVANHGLVAGMKGGLGTFEAMGATQAYFGDPAKASVEEGEKIWAVLVRMWVETIQT